MLQEHLQSTYEFLFDEAHRALGETGSFRPFGAGVRRSGEQIETQVSDPDGERDPQSHVGGLIAGFQEEDRKHGLIAAGVVFNGQMADARGPHTHALIFHLEAANGRALEVVVPYEVKVGQIIEFLEPAISEVPPEIFPESQQ